MPYLCAACGLIKIMTKFITKISFQAKLEIDKNKALANNLDPKPRSQVAKRMTTVSSDLEPTGLTRTKSAMEGPGPSVILKYILMTLYKDINFN